MPTCRRSIHLHAKQDRINASLQACMITALIYASMSHRLLCACVACAHMKPHDDLPQSTGNSPMPARSVHLLQTRRPPANVHSLLIIEPAYAGLSQAVPAPQPDPDVDED